MKPISINKVYNNIDDSKACWVTFQFANGTTTEIIIDGPNYRKLACLAMEQGFKLQHEKDAEGYIRREKIDLTKAN